MVDLSHILTNLNKLDAGVDEKIMLTSRDEQSCLVVSYREVSVLLQTPGLCVGRALNKVLDKRGIDQELRRECVPGPVAHTMIAGALV